MSALATELTTPWQMRPLKYLAQLNPETLGEDTPPSFAFNYVDIGAVGRGRLVERPEQMTFETAPSRARRVLRPGDTILSTVRTYLRAISQVPQESENWVGSTGFAAIRPLADEMDARFLYYWLGSDPFIEEVVARSIGVSYPAISANDVANLPVPVPGLEEQRRIADMLDRETARIDTLIAKNQRVVGLVAEREAAAISGFLGAGGLERDASKRKAHLRWLDCNIQTGPFGSQLHAEEYVTDGWPVINPSNIQDDRLIADTNSSVDSETRSRLARHTLRVGDVVFARRGEMGRAAVVAESESGWLCGTGCLRVRFQRPVFLPAYLREVLSSHGVRAWFELMAVGTTMANLNEDLLGDLPVPVRTIDEQREIMAAVRPVRSKATELREGLLRQVSILHERREALITAAVTGAIDV